MIATPLFPTWKMTALAAVILVAERHPEPITSANIAQGLNIARRYLEAHLQMLVREGILHGGRGPKGGYRLMHAANQTTMAQIYTLTRGKIFDPGKGDDPTSRAEQIAWQIEAKLIADMSHLTIAQLIDQPASRAA